MATLLVACVDRGPYPVKEGPPTLYGDSAQYTLFEPARAPRLTPFQTADGTSIDLSKFGDKTILLNFWATWCASCVYEMPSLDRLAAALAGPNFAVVAVAVDRAGITSVAPFFHRNGLKNLPIYLDPEGRTAYALADNPKGAEFALYGLPISYIVDNQGHVAGYVPGAVDWDSDAARALITFYIHQKKG